MVWLKNEILNFQEDYLETDGRKTYEDISEDKAVDMLADADNLEIILQYLLRSKKIFVECTSGKEGSTAVERQRELLELYHLFSEENIEEFTLEMQRSITKFLEKIRRRNAQYAGKRVETAEV